MEETKKEKNAQLECWCGARPVVFRGGTDHRTYIQCKCGKRSYQDPMWNFDYLIKNWREVVGPKKRGKKDGFAHTNTNKKEEPKKKGFFNKLLGK